MTACSRLRLRRLAAAVLVGCLLSGAPAVAQSSVISARPGAPKELHIMILEGEDALNNIRQRTAREPIVKVEDENHKPVAGAAILFAIHGSSTGAGGSFAGATTLSVQTDINGQAVAHGFHPNAVNGKYEIEAVATVGVLVATILIHEENIGAAAVTDSDTVKKTGRKILTKKVIITSGVIVGIGIIITVAVLNGNHGATITAGAGGVGHP